MRRPPLQSHPGALALLRFAIRFAVAVRWPLQVSWRDRLSAQVPWLEVARACLRPSLVLAGVPRGWCHALAMAAAPRLRLTIGPGPDLPLCGASDCR